jgi:hypothetical protein
MANKQCPHCKKMVEHRKVCPVLRKIREKETAILNFQKAAEEKIAMIRLNNEIEALSLNHPQVVEYIKTLEEKICNLEEKISYDKYREEQKSSCGSSYEEDY